MNLPVSALRPVLILSLSTALSATAGTVSIGGPLTTDESTGISPSNVYTHVISGGSAATVNGVVFSVLNANETPPGITWDSTGNKGNILLEQNNIGDWLPADGGVTGAGLLGLLSSFTYAPQGAEAGSSQTFTLAGLNPGTVYDTRLYIRVWDTEGSGRPIAFTMTNGAEVDLFGGPEDRPGQILGTNNDHQAYYVNYRFQAQGETLVINAAVPGDAPANSGSFHLYALTNQVVPEPGTAALLGVVALAGLNRRRRA